jgi:hypothetical protein
MKSIKPSPDIESDDSTLLQYESLRLQALNKAEAFCERSLGLTLLIRQGMLAWIEVCHKCIPANPIERPKIPVFKHKATSEMIKVMANITLSNLQEICL